MKKNGILLILAAVALPLFGYLPLMGQNNSAAILSQYFGSASLILMGITQLLATRIRGIEPLFGPMDKVYGLHKWLGIGALATAFLHSSIDAEINGVALVGRLADQAEGLGELSYNGLIVLTLASLVTIIPYNIWKWSHRFIGVFFTLAAAHYIFIEKPFSTFEPLGLYITFFCGIGVLSYLYLLIPRFLGHNNAKYEVTSVEQQRDVAIINMRPDGNGIKHKAGQFAFVNFDPLNLRETHPFTISSAPTGTGELSFRVKGLGRYTERMGKVLKPGMTARVSRPFGHFTLKPTKGAQVWVGGGIGITPFMAWAESLTPDWQTPTTLYYCVSTGADALNVETFERIAAEVPAFEFVLVESKEGKRLSADQIAAELPEDMDIREAHLYFCGPAKYARVAQERVSPARAAAAQLPQ